MIHKLTRRQNDVLERVMKNLKDNVETKMQFDLEKTEGEHEKLKSFKAILEEKIELSKQLETKKDVERLNQN